MSRSTRGAARCRRGPRRRGQAGHRLLRGASRPGRGGAAGVVRHLRAPRVRADRDVQRGPHRGHHPGHLRVPGRGGHRRAAVPRRGHPRAVRARPRSARWRCSPPTASGCCWTRAAGTPRPRRCPGPSWRTTQAGPARRADGIVVTPSHNPPPDGGFKYNPPDGGPAGTDITSEIQDRANELLAGGLAGVRRVPYARALARRHHREVRLPGRLRGRPGPGGRPGRHPGRRGAHRRRPAGRRQRAYWGEIGERYGLDLTVVNPAVDATFRFMTLDWDGKIRMDCSSPSAMASLIARQHDFTHRHRQRHRRRPARHRHARTAA